MPIDGLFVILRFKLIDISQDKNTKQQLKYNSMLRYKYYTSIYFRIILNSYKTYQTKIENIMQSIS